MTEGLCPAVAGDINTLCLLPKARAYRFFFCGGTQSPTRFAGAPFTQGGLIARGLQPRRKEPAYVKTAEALHLRPLFCRRLPLCIPFPESSLRLVGKTSLPCVKGGGTERDGGIVPCRSRGYKYALSIAKSHSVSVFLLRWDTIPHPLCGSPLYTRGPNSAGPAAKAPSGRELAP